MSTNRRGFTLTEAIVALVLATVVFAVGVMLLRNSRRVQGNRASLNNLKQLALAVYCCNDTFGRLPPAYGPLGKPPVPGSYTLHFHLLPFVDQKPYWRAVPPETDAQIWIFSSWQDESLPKDLRGVQNYAANLRVFSDKGLATPFDADIDFGELGNSATWDTGNGTGRFPEIFRPRGTAAVIMFSTRFSNDSSRPTIPGAPNCSWYWGKPYHENGAFFGSKAARDIARNRTFSVPIF